MGTQQLIFHVGTAQGQEVTEAPRESDTHTHSPDGESRGAHLPCAS